MTRVNHLSTCSQPAARRTEAQVVVHKQQINKPLFPTRVLGFCLLVLEPSHCPGLYCPSALCGHTRLLPKAACITPLLRETTSCRHSERYGVWPGATRVKPTPMV